MNAVRSSSLPPLVVGVENVLILIDKSTCSYFYIYSHCPAIQRKKKLPTFILDKMRVEKKSIYMAIAPIKWPEVEYLAILLNSLETILLKKIQNL